MNSNGNTLAIPINTDAGKKLQSRLNQDKTLEAIEHLLSRIDTLDKAVQDLSTMMRQGPGLVAMAADIADESYRKADAEGVSIEDRLSNALHLAEKLTAPAMIEKLDGLLKFADQAPGLVAMKIDIIDEAYRDADARGVNIDDRLKSAVELAEKLTDPVMTEKLNGLLKLGDQMPGLIAMGADIFDEQMRNANNDGFDPENLIEVAKTANRALTNARNEPPAKVGGIFGMLRILKDPDRQRGLGFLMNFLKHFGKNI
ncbi:MAG: DUF1641 domain-containing protein [Saprospiraceae bacterium]